MKRRECINPGCANDQFSRGACRPCYMFAWRHGRLPNKLSEDESLVRQRFELEKLKAAYAHACTPAAQLRMRALISDKEAVIADMHNKQ